MICYINLKLRRSSGRRKEADILLTEAVYNTVNLMQLTKDSNEA